MKNKKTRKRTKKSVSLFIQELIDINFFYYLCRILPAIILLALFFLPMEMGPLNLLNSNSTAELIYPFMLFKAFTPGSIYFYVSFIIYFIPANVVYMISSCFFKSKKRNKGLHFILNYISLTIYLGLSICCMLVFANATRWFIQLPWYIYTVNGVTLILHFLMTMLGLNLVRSSNPDYTEYKRIEKISKTKTKTSIRTKLIVTFTATISIILLIFMELALNSYQHMFTIAISDAGYSQAQQTANVYDSADGTYEKILTFFEQQKESNKYAETPFERIDIIIPKVPIINVTNLYMEQVMFALPNFDTLAYTTAVNYLGIPKPIPDDEKFISGDDALEYVRKFQNGTYRKSPVYNKKNKTAKYFYPVTLTRTRGHLLQGFAVVTYRQELLMSPLIQTKVFVITMVILFIYISLIISLVIADLITNPLLFLKSNVKKTSNSLSMILSGSSNMTAEKLNFDDSVKTHDEIKNLSGEIKNMVSLIKGVIPFISTSTLKAAENENVKMSTSKDLCFLFTDMRGFTSLCEGRKPKDIVDILNHYLEIKTKIILKNDGDVDKFVGDEMMAFFAGPKKEYNACKAAMEIRKAMRQEQQQALSNGEDFISIGIGINTGKVVFGSVGSEARRDFTSIGDVVNTAARLESANKAYGTKSLITEAVYKKLQDKFVCREMDYITVKGKKEICRIYEILQEKESASDKLYDIKNLFEQGLEFYRKQKWEKAEECFNECATSYNDMPSIIFLDRIAQFKENPPPKKWDGVYNLQHK